MSFLIRFRGQPVISAQSLCAPLRWVLLLFAVFMASPTIVLAQTHDPQAAINESITVQAQIEERIEQGHPIFDEHGYPGLIEHYESVINEFGNVPETVSLHYAVIELYDVMEDHESVVRHLNTMLEMDFIEANQLPALYARRAEAYEGMGMPLTAANDHARARELYSRQGVQYDLFRDVPMRERIQEFLGGQLGLSRILQGTISLFSLFIAWLLSCLICIWRGQRQQREANGTFAQTLRASAILGVMIIAPAAMSLILYHFAPLGWDLSWALSLGPLLMLLLMWWVSASLLPPGMWIDSQEALPEVDDPDVLADVKRICEQMKLPETVVHTFPSFGGSLVVQAFAGGVGTSSITVSDGVLLRLEPHERNAIIGHELGHIANGSLWWYPATASIACVATVAFVVAVPFLVALLWGIACYMGLFRIVSRVFEYDCDQRAARAVGHRETIHALDKIYSASPIHNTNFRSYLAFTLATHPSHEERLSAIQNDPQNNERIEEPFWSESIAKKRHIGSIVALGIWVLLMIVTAVSSLFFNGGWIATTISVGLIILPNWLLNSAVRKEVKADAKRVNKQQQQSKGSGKWILFLIGLFIAFFFMYLDSDASMFDRFLAGFEYYAIWGIVLFVFFVLLFSFRAGKGLQAKIVRLVNQHRWQDVLDLEEDQPKKFAKTAMAPYYAALSRWMLGQRTQALDEMIFLVEEEPNTHYLPIAAAVMYIELRDTSKALELLHDLQEQTPGDYAPFAFAASCYLIRKDYEQAEEMLRRLRGLIPDHANLPILEARMMMQQGNSERACELIIEAEKRAPGDVAVVMIETEYEFRFGDHDRGMERLQKSRELLDASPFAFLEWRYSDLSDLSKPLDEITFLEEENE